jgi:hypothetical protein
MCAICNWLLRHSLYLCLGYRSVLRRKGGLFRAMSLSGRTSGIGDRHRTGRSSGTCVRDIAICSSELPSLSLLPEALSVPDRLSPRKTSQVIPSKM